MAERLDLIVSINSTQFQKDVEDVKKGFTDAAFGIGEAASDKLSVFSRIAGFVNKTEAVREFISELVRVRSECQSVETSFATLLKSKEKANVLMAQIAETVAGTPFSLTEVAAGAKQLIVYGVQAEEVNTTLLKLGDIATGLDVPLNQMTHLYGKVMMQSSLYTADLEQFTSLGVPMLQGLADMYGVSAGEVGRMVDAGKIGFPEVQQVMENLTGAGGQFYGLLQAQSETITGKVGNLSDAWNNMLNEIGKSNDSIINGTLDGAQFLVEHYEEVGKVLISLVATYGAYKAACIAHMLLTQTLATTQMELGMVLLKVQKSFAALTAGMNLNHWVLAATAIVAIGAAMWAFRDSTDAAERAQKNFNDEQDRFGKQQDEKKQRVDKLIRTLQDELETEQAKITAYEELKVLSPALTKAYDREGLAALKAADSQKILNKERDDADYANIISNIDLLVVRLKKLKEEDGKIVVSIVGGEVMSYTIDNTNAIDGLESELMNYRNKQDKINKIQKKIEEDAKSVNQKTYGELVKDYVAEIVAAQAALNELTKNGARTSEQDISNARSRVDNSKASYKNLTGKDYDSKDTNTSDQQRQLNRQILDNELALAKDRLSVIEDGRKKRLAQSGMEWQEKKDALDREYKETVEAYAKIGKATPEKVKTTLQARQKENDTAKSGRDASINAESDKEFIDHQQSLTAYLLSEEDKRKLAIKERYDNERAWAKKQLDGGNMTQEQHNEYSVKIDTAETQEGLKGLLDQYKNYSQQRVDIEQQFNDQAKTLESERTSENSLQIDQALQELNKKKKESLSGNSVAEFKDGIDFEQVFGNLDALSTGGLEILRSKLGEYIATASKDLAPEDLKDLSDAFQKIDFKVAEKSPFGEFTVGLENYKKATGELAKAQQDLAAVQAGKAVTAVKGYDAVTGEAIMGLMTLKEAETQLMEAQSNRAGSLEKMNVSLHSGVGKAQEYLGVAQAMTGALDSFGVEVPEEVTGVIEGLGTTLGSLAEIDLTNPMSIITGVIGAIGGIGKAIGSIFNKDGRKEKNIQKLQEQIDVLDVSYNNLGKAIEDAYSQDASKMIGQQNEMLEQQKVLIQNQIAEEESKKKSDSGKIDEWKNQIDDINNTLSDNKVKAQDAIFGADVKSAIDDFANAYADAWASGEDKASAMKDVVKNMIKGVIIEMLKSDLATTVQQIRNKIEAALADGIITDAEQLEIDQLAEEAAQGADQKYSWADKYMKDGEKASGSSSQESTSGGFATMSQESADELNGRFTALQMIGEEMRAMLVQQSPLFVEMALNMDTVRLHTQDISTDLSEMKDLALTSMNHLSAIEKNTKHLQFMRDDLSKIKEKVNNL